MAHPESHMTNKVIDMLVNQSGGTLTPGACDAAGSEINVRRAPFSSLYMRVHEDYLCTLFTCSMKQMLTSRNDKDSL